MDSSITQISKLHTLVIKILITLTYQSGAKQIAFSLSSGGTLTNNSKVCVCYDKRRLKPLPPLSMHHAGFRNVEDMQNETCLLNKDE